jgi:N utilization substance protein B
MEPTSERPSRKGKRPPLRRGARLLALQALYESDAVGHPVELCLSRLAEESPLPETGRAFARELVQGVMNHLSEIDSVIRRLAPSWPVEQLAIVDRNILRLAIFELLFDSKTPPKAAINEAVELAKLFGSESSPKFVNGVLGSVMEEVEKASLPGNKES